MLIPMNRKKRAREQGIRKQSYIKYYKIICIYYIISHLMSELKLLMILKKIKHQI